MSSAIGSPLSREVALRAVFVAHDGAHAARRSTTRRMFPGSVMSKTMIGRLLSMHSEMAVESMTFRFRLSTSM